MDKAQRYWKYLICVMKLFIAFIYVQLHKKSLYSQDIWAIIEKHTEARDNGYHLYKYIRTNHPEVNAWFMITKDASDRKKVIPYKSVIDADSIKHYIYYLSAKYSIGSQKFGACPYPTDWVNRFHFLCRKDQKVIFLQHGVTINAGKGLEFEKTHFDLFICAANQEYKYVIDKLKYPPEKAKLIGFCRYDNLNQDNNSKQIVIMPTFRIELSTRSRDMEATQEECDAFIKSDYYKSFSQLISNKELLLEAKKYGYSIIFYLHYSLQPYTKTFNKYNNTIVTIADRMHYDVQQLMIDSAIMVTDYSSVFCDFAYMKKPEVFYQFDEKEFRSKHYSKGFFDYRHDGFGPVFTNGGDVVQYLIWLMENGCRMEQKYQERVDTFFAFRDNHNCERNFEAIKALDK